MSQEVYIWVGVIVAIGAVVGFASYFEKKRSEALSNILSRLGFDFSAEQRSVTMLPFNHLPFGDRGRNAQGRNVARRKESNRELLFCDYRYTTGSGKHKSTHHYSVLCLTGGIDLPEFSLSKEDIFSKIAQGLGYADIDIESDAQFSKMFVLRGKDVERIRALFSPEITQQLRQFPKICLEAGRGAIILYRNGKVKPEEVTGWIEQSKQLISLFAR